MNWRRQHRWSSLTVCFFLLTMCLSGIALNHRPVTDCVDVSRRLLPPFYYFNNWNQGLMRGSVSLGSDSVLVYGSAGLWLTDRRGSRFNDFNTMLPDRASAHAILSAARYGDTLLVLTPETLYISNLRDTNVSRRIQFTSDERLSDMSVTSDSIVITGRSHLYASPIEQLDFKKISLLAPDEHDFGRKTLFDKVWRFHSGEMFGTGGRLVVDAVACVLIFLIATGFMIWLLPRIIRRKARGRRDVKPAAHFLKTNVRLHGRIGYYTLIFTAVCVFSGWLLRPPFLIALATLTTPAAECDNPWHDSLRMLRYDPDSRQWLLLTSCGAYTLSDLHARPVATAVCPPVSVMGPTVFRQIDGGDWLVGSFSGLYRWNVNGGTVRDYFTGAPAEKKAGPPFGRNAVAGYSDDFDCGTIVVTYDRGTDLIAQPDSLRYLPMPLWNVALETHTGRIFFGTAATWFYITLLGALTLWSLLSGLLHHRRRKH